MADTGGGRSPQAVVVDRFRDLLRVAKCAGVDYTLASPTAIPRADTEQLRQVFNRYASVEQDGRLYMNADDFVRKYLGLYQEPNFNRETVRIVAGAADTTKDGLISFEEFAAFEACLCRYRVWVFSPDALYLTAFEMFDVNGSDSVNYSEFERLIRHTQPVMEMNFDFDCSLIKRYFGNEKDRDITYFEFCQLLHDFYDELGIQAFKRCDKDGTGYISSVDFQNIMFSVKRHLLTEFVKNNLIAVGGGALSHKSGKLDWSFKPGGPKVNYPYYAAFNALLSKIELIKRIYLTNAGGNLHKEFTQEEFLLAAQSYAQVTPAEVDILFHLADLAHPGQRNVSFSDLERIDPERLKRVTMIRSLTHVKLVDSPEQRGVGTQVLESMYRFTMGSLAGAAGATAVYPVDLVKTRMQNQRTGMSRGVGQSGGSFIGEVMYKNSFDCFRKVLRHEGALGLYRGLLPQIVGVAPEKAIKLTMNDFMRDKLRFEGDHLPIWAECVAGGCGGASQVMFTNPLEIVKIRLQVAGEIAGPRVSVFTILRDLGFFGLYKGSRACFLRDIPFSAIYFPVYAHAKTYTADANGHNNVPSLFASAFVAGVPAAALVTPADVIKTRLQVAERAGQTTYSGLIDCYRKVTREEGWKALWKGTVARVCRSSPQFAVTLLTYEVLQRLFYVDFGGRRPEGSEVPAHMTLADVQSTHPDHVGGYALAKATFAGIESKFGLFLPRFELRAHRPAGYHASSVDNLSEAA